MLAAPRWEQHCQSSTLNHSEAKGWLPLQRPAAADVGKSEAGTRSPTQTILDPSTTAAAMSLTKPRSSAALDAGMHQALH